MNNKQRGRFALQENDVFRQPQSQSPIRDSKEQPFDKVKRLLKEGFCRNMPIEQRAMQLATRTYKTRSDISEGQAPTTARFNAYLKTVEKLVRQYAAMEAAEE